MDRIFSVIYYTVLKSIRDKTAVMETLLFPIVLILILGTALGSAFKPAGLREIDIGYHGDESSVLLMHFEKVVVSDEVDELVEAIRINTYEEGMELLQEGEILAFIILDESSTDNIKVYKGNNMGEINTSIIETIVDRFANGMNIGYAVHSIGGILENNTSREIIEDRGISPEGKRPRAIDYYAVTMLVMIMLYGANYGIFLMGEDYVNTLGMRIRSTPMRPSHHFLGKTIGIVLAVFCQSVILVLFTKYVYGVSWGEKPLMILSIIFVFSVLTTGLGVMLCMLTKNAMKASGILNIVVPITTFISGGYMPIPNSEGFLRVARYLSPNYLAQTAIFNTVYDGSSNQTYAFMGGMMIIILITFGISGIVGRRKLA